MAILFAAYIPDLERMLWQLIVQCIILTILAVALVSYASDYSPTVRCIVAVLGGCIAGVLIAFYVQSSNYRINVDFVVGFFELWAFAVFGGAGMLAGAVCLAMYCLFRHLFKAKSG